MSLPRCARLAFAALLLTTIATPTVAEDLFRIRDEEGRHLDVFTPEGKPVLRYMYARDRSSKETSFDTAKVYAHVFAADGKTLLTKGPGGLFPHHRGIFIGWNKLKHGGGSHDLWHVRNTEQLHQEFVATKAEADGAVIVSRIDWIGTDGKPVIEETRTHRVTTPEGAHVVIDFTSAIKAVSADVELGGDPEHAGCQFRPSQKVAENKSAKYTFHEEGVDCKKDLDLPWVAETFKIGDHLWTVQHMSHPDNPKGARWSAYRDYGRFGPFTVVKIPEGETATFRYRFRITAGDAPDRESLGAAYQHYRAS